MFPENNDKTWRIIVLLSFFLLVVIIPLQIIYPRIHFSSFPFLYWIVNLILIIDAVYNFIFSKKRYKDIPYTKSEKFSWFYFTADVIAALPLGIITGSYIFDLFRFIKVVRIFNYMRDISLRTLRFSNYLYLIYFLYLFILSTHLLSCGWIAINERRLNTADEYISSLYWCIQTLTTVGYGDVTMPDIHHKIYAMVVMLFGVGVYGSVIGIIANILLKNNPARTQFLENTEKLRSFVNFRKLPDDLQKKIQNYYEYLYKEKIGAEESKFISGLPAGLRNEVELYLKRNILQKIPLFKGIDDNFLREVSLYLSPVVYTPGDYVFKEGDRGDEMYFIIKGRIKILQGDESKIISTLSDGDFFGELALIRNEIRNATAKSETYSDVYILRKEILDRVLKFYPDISLQIKRVAGERISL